jgi:hypothetical protein
LPEKDLLLVLGEIGIVLCCNILFLFSIRMFSLKKEYFKKNVLVFYYICHILAEYKRIRNLDKFIFEENESWERLENIGLINLLCLGTNNIIKINDPS